MPDATPEDWITSKEILSKTGISRATLNNYINMEIIPRPVVRRPPTDMKGTKKIGYFPFSVLERIEQVGRLKQAGYSMDEISARLRDRTLSAGAPDRDRPGPFEPSDAGMDFFPGPDGGLLRLTLEDIRSPAYLLNYDFEVEWASRAAEVRIFGQEVNRIKQTAGRNIFKLFFNWEFHSQVDNWRDLMAFHVSFLKIKFAGSWIVNLYEGITQNEVSLLQETYDSVSAFPVRLIRHTPMELLYRDGTRKTYQIYTVFFKEGIFFLYEESPSPSGARQSSSAGGD